MRYRVVWRQRIQNQMHTSAFLLRERGGDTKPMRDAIRSIEDAMTSNPEQVGESRGGNERVFIVAPLSVQYEVFEDDRIVLIYEATLHPRRKL